MGPDESHWAGKSAPATILTEGLSTAKEYHVNRTAVLATALLLFSGSAWAQMTPPKPGAEVKKLDYFVGSWTVEATIGQGPWGAGGKFSSTDNTDWISGNFYTMGHGDFKMPPELGGDGKETTVMGYDTDQNVYTRDTFNSIGRHEAMKGSVSGDTWTWTNTANFGGQDVNQKMTLKILSPTSYNMKFEVSIDGTNWMPFMEGKVTKK
jgi:Protein of unknown function (DUF1579)